MPTRHRIITRAEWGAQYGTGKWTDGAKPRLIAHNDGNDRSRADATLEEDIALMRFLEHYHVKERPEPLVGIGYTLVAMQSGRIFEGRGFDRVGGHTKGLNSSAYAVCFPINGQRTAPSSAAVEAFHWIREEGVRLGHLSARHVVSGHRDHGATTCPGDRVYDVIVKGAAAPVVPPSFRDFARAHPTLRSGKGGVRASTVDRNLVKLLQAKLRTLELLRPHDVTGYFGPLTEQAVRAFQRQRGLAPDGIVGPKTWAALGV